MRIGSVVALMQNSQVAFGVVTQTVQLWDGNVWLMLDLNVNGRRTPVMVMENQCDPVDPEDAHRYLLQTSGNKYGPS